MEQNQLELSVISFLLKSEEQLYKAREKGVNAKSFVAQKKIYEFVCDYLQEYGKLPSSDTVSSVYGITLLASVDGEFCIDLLLKRELRRHMENVLAEGIQMLAEDEAEKGLEFILAHLGRVRRTGRYAFGFTDGDATERIERMEQRRSLGKLFGELFNLPVHNIPSGTMIGIIGRTGVGKSFKLLKLSQEAYSKGKRILFISPEMTRAEVEVRWDTLASGLFTPEALLGGSVPVKAYREWLESVAGRRDWITFDSHYGNPFTVPAVGSLIGEFQPDVVGIDGLSLLAGEGGEPEKGWEGVKEVSYGLQSLAVSRKVHILVTQQATRDAAGAVVPDLHQISYGDSFGQACGVVISLGFHKDEKTRYLAVIKNRFGRVARPREIPFDPGKGIIG